MAENDRPSSSGSQTVISSDNSVGSNSPFAPVTSSLSLTTHNRTMSDTGDTDTPVQPASGQQTDGTAAPPVTSSGNQGTMKKPLIKRTPNDFIFGKVIGEGSFSTVYIAKEVSTQTEFAIKVCDKKFILKEKKGEYIMREKTVLTKTNHPFIIKLYYTFQDSDRLYFVLQYARNGELLYYLNKLSSFDLQCTRFYAAQVVVALEYLQSQGVIHRDLKPENILLNENMHILITDFGSSKVIMAEDGISKDESVAEARPTSSQGHRRNSFVGTAQYVSPEVLNSKKAYFSSDLWALGCIIFQFLSGETPFRGGHEYQIFQKVCKLEYEIPEGFNPTAADLVRKLMVLDPTQRLGCKEMGGMSVLKQHSFFEGIVWNGMEEQKPPELMPYLPATERNPEFWSSQTGFDDQRLAEIIISNDHSHDKKEQQAVVAEISQEVHKQKLAQQVTTNEYHQFVQGNLILKQGKVLKRKGLFARKRMLLLTEGPHLYYVDYTVKEKVLKGQIPWSKDLKPEAKNFKIFFVHTPNRTYYLESRASDALDWEKKIYEVWQRYYGNKEKS